MSARQLRQLVCQGCGKEYERNLYPSQQSLYCGKSCQSRAAAERLHAKQMEDRRVLIEEVEFFLGLGESAYTICRVLKKSPAAITRMLYRAGRGDLTKPFERYRSEERSWQHPCVECGGPGPRSSSSTGRCADCGPTYGAQVKRENAKAA